MILQWFQTHPVLSIVLLYFAIGACGDAGQVLAADHPRAAAAFKGLSYFGSSALRIARLFVPSIPGPEVLQGLRDSADSTPPTKRDARERGSVVVEVCTTVAVAGVAAVLAYFVAACGPSQRVGAYGAHLAACEDASNSCEEYVACRDRVELAAGRGHYLATCLPATVDAGAEGGAR